MYTSGLNESRHYGRHWTPVQMDIVVADIEAATQRVNAVSTRQARRAHNKNNKADGFQPPLLSALHAMRIAALLIFLSATHAALAEDCKNIAIPVSAKITIIPDVDTSSNMYHVRLPSTIGSDELHQLVFSAHEKVDGQLKEISLPLAIKTKGDQTGSYFYRSPGWLNIQVIGMYGKNLCTEITATLDM